MVMRVVLNGETRQLAHDEAAGVDLLLPDLLSDIGFAEIPVLVEHNGVALRPRDHESIVINDGDRLEIIRIVAGG